MTIFPTLPELAIIVARFSTKGVCITCIGLTEIAGAKILPLFFCCGGDRDFRLAYLLHDFCLEEEQSLTTVRRFQTSEAR
jgi:hypothetical protein